MELFTHKLPPLETYAQHPGVVIRTMFNKASSVEVNHIQHTVLKIDKTQIDQISLMSSLLGLTEFLQIQKTLNIDLVILSSLLEAAELARHADLPETMHHAGMLIDTYFPFDGVYMDAVFMSAMNSQSSVITTYQHACDTYTDILLAEHGSPIFVAHDTETTGALNPLLLI